MRLDSDSIDRMSRVNKQEEITNNWTRANSNKTIANKEPSLGPLSSFSPFPIPVIIVLGSGVVCVRETTHTQPCQ